MLRHPNLNIQLNLTFIRLLLLSPMQNSIKLWVEKIQSRPLGTLTLIKDQDYLQTILRKLEPSYFKADAPSYDSLVDSIVQYYRKELYLEVATAMKTARKDQDPLQLWIMVLGIAIRCEQRNQNIQLILDLDEKTQSSLMEFISRIDDTLAACPSLGLEASSKKQNTNLEKHLLTTIDQLSEENAQFRNKIEQLEDQFNSYKADKQILISSLQASLDQVHAEIEEVLSDFQGVYNSDSIVTIIKTILTENHLLKETIDKREGIAQELEVQKEELIKKINKMAEINKILKTSQSDFDLLQAKVDEQLEEISQLRKSENDLLSKVFSLEKGSSPSKFQKRPLARSNTFQPIPEQEQHNPRESHSYRPPVDSTPNKYTERLLRSIKKKGSTIAVQLQPYEREKEHITLIQTQEQKLEDLSKQLQLLSQELQLKSVEIKYSAEKNKQIEDKLKHTEGINEIYIQNIKEKELIIGEKNEQYEIRFGDLMLQIESLKAVAEQANANTETVQTESHQNILANSNKYEEKLKTIMDMLEAELISFRNKELQYLETIRQLKMKKGNDIFNSILDLGRSSAFKLERSDIEEPASEIKDSEDDQGSENKLSRLDSRRSKGSETGTFNLVHLQNRVKDLFEQLSLLKTQTIETQSKIQDSFARQTLNIRKITQLTEQSITLKLQIKTLRERFIQSLQSDLARLKQGKTQNKESTENQIENIDKKLKSLEKLTEEIQQLKNKREEGTNETEGEKHKLLQFLKEQLKELGPKQNTQLPIQIITNETDNSEHKINLQKNEKYLSLQQELRSTSNQNHELRKEIISMQSEMNRLKQSLIVAQEEKEISIRKIQEMESKLSSEQTSNINYYTEVSHLLQQIRGNKEKQRQQNQLISDLEAQIKNKESGEQINTSSFKMTNNKLVKDYEKQGHLFALFRNKYKELLEKYRSMEEQHRLMLSTFTDLVVTCN